MNKIILILLAVMMAGCGSNPVIVPFPNPPEVLMKPAPDLQKIETTPEHTTVKDFLETVSKNYSQYYLTKEQLAALQKWVKDQQAVK